MKEIFLNTEIIQNTYLSDTSIATYTILRMLQYKDNELAIDINSIAYYLFKNTTYDKNFTSKISKSIEDLIENKYISIIERLNSSTYVLDLTNIYLDTSKELFVKTNDKEVSSIMNTKMINFKLLRYYLVLLSTINNNTKVGFDTQEALTFKSDVNRTTINTYNKKLQEMDLIYVRSSQDFLHSKKDKTVSKIANHYSRVEHKKLCDKQMEEFLKNYGYKGRKVGKEK